MSFEIKVNLESLVKEYQLFLSFVRESTAYCIEVLRIFKHSFNENLYVFETPNLPSFVFTFVVIRVFNHSRKKLMTDW